MAKDPETRLDRIGRDLSRTLLHGSRANDGRQPWTIATGQQVRVDLPARDGLTFQFTVPGNDGNPTSILAPVDHDNAAKSQAAMTQVFSHRDTYLALKAAEDIPTWIFSQRIYSIAKSPPREDTIDVTVPRDLTIIKAPASALSEVADKDDCYVSLYQFDSTIKKMVPVHRSNWQPAIMVRFKLQRAEKVSGLPAEAQVFEIKGTSQAERYFLDKLGLLSKFLPGTGAATSVPPPGIESVTLALQHTSAGPLSPVSDWTIVRTNLTREARSGQQSLRFVGPPKPLDLPYVAAVNSHDAPDQIYQQSLDSVTLLQMGSITNSGGYFLRANTTATDADTLILAVVLQAKPDTGTDYPESAWLPAAANALAYTHGNAPDSIRFNGLDHITIAPATPTGSVAFGWTRTVPKSITLPEDKFGYGTISLVEYSAEDGASVPIGPSAESCIAISPSQQPHGDPYERSRPLVLDKSVDTYSRHTGRTAAMRLLAPDQPKARSLMPEEPKDDVETHYYHSTLQCFETKQNRYTRIGDALRRQITIAPGFFRDVFGNRFQFSGPSIQRHLFYTDKLTSPGEWPGMRLAIYPGAQNGKPCLFLEGSYRFVEPAPEKPTPDDLIDYQQRKQTRLDALNEILLQVRGVDGDVAIALSAAPLVKGDLPLAPSAFQDFIKKSIVAETAAGPGGVPTPLPMDAIPIPCLGTADKRAKFEPRLAVYRNNPDYGPSDTDLPSPSDGVLALQIKSQIMSASSLIALQTKTSLPTTAIELRNWADSRTDPANDSESEFRKVAEAFDQQFSVTFATRFGFLRNRLNQHELWLFPNVMFPTALDHDWSFATARPLQNTLGTETFLVPDFTERCTSTNPGDCWGNYPLRSQTVVDQDFDRLGRIAFRQIEQGSSDLALVTAAENVGPARQLLHAREQLGLTLSVFGKQAPAYLVPLHELGDDLDGEAVTRAAKDAFLSDLSGFYAVDTILQLPLDKPGDKEILTFEGKVTAFDAHDKESPSVSANFSDILLSGGKSKVTILYDLPPDVSDANSAAQATKLRAQFSHVQLPPDGAQANADNPFNQGPWIEMINPPVLEWKAPATFIPVATRSFPTKPVMNSTEVLMPWMDPKTLEIKIPGAITASTAELLVHWGWKFSFSLIDLSARENDRVHVTTSYNEPPSLLNQAKQLDFLDGWKPTSLLNGLFALKSLSDSALLQDPTVTGLVRLQVAADLADFLCDELAATSPARFLTMKLPLDNFEIDIPPQPIPSNPIPPNEDKGGREVMKGDLGKKAITVQWSGNDQRLTAVVTAPADIPGNNARLAGANAVQNYKATLNLRRNEAFGPSQPEQTANSCLIYNCPPVASPLECWAQNIWSMPLKFDAEGKPLPEALTAFFNGILKGADPTAVLIEVGAALVWMTGELDVVTPFSLIPKDIPAGDAAAIAAFINDKYQKLTSTSKPDKGLKPTLRIRVKLLSNSTVKQFEGRVLMEIKAIDFPL